MWRISESITDADGLDTAKGEDKMLGAVMSNGRVATSDAGVPEAPVDSNVTYQWVRINGMDDDTLDSDDNGTITPAERDDDPEDANNIGMDASYTVVADDIGAKIKVKVTIQDDAHTLVTKTDPEMLDSGSVNVPATLSIAASPTDVSEGGGTGVGTISVHGVFGRRRLCRSGSEGLGERTVPPRPARLRDCDDR